LEYKPVSERQTPLTGKEEVLLMELAKKYPSGTKGKIRWKDLGSAWRIRWTAGKEIHESDIHPRSVKQLHNRHTYITKSRGSKPTTLPVESEGHSDDEDDESEEDEEKKDEEEKPGPTVTAASTLQTLANIFTIKPGEVDAPDEPEADEIEPQSASTAVTLGKRKYHRWTAEAQQEFRKLYTEHIGKRWTYGNFVRVWKADQYGAVDAARWKARNLTESRRLKSAEGKKMKRG
jgi:hypothetical protein